MVNVVLPEDTWVDIYADPDVIAAGISAGDQIEVVNITPNDVRLASVENPDGNSDHIPLLFGRATAVNDPGDLEAHAFCKSGGAIDVVATGA